MSFLPLWPAAALMATAAVAIVLEVVGAPSGARKLLVRVHLPWLVTGGCAVAAWCAWVAFQRQAIDAPSLIAVAVLSGTLAVTHFSAVGFLRSIDEERGELSAAYLLFGAGACVVATSTNLVLMASGLMLSSVAGAFLAAPDREGPHGIEAAARLVVSSGTLLALGVVGAAFCALASGTVELLALQGDTSPEARAAFAVVFFWLASTSGAVPLQQRFVDVAHGAASSATGLFASTGLLLGGLLALRLVAVTTLPALHIGLVGLAVLSLVGAPLAALSQVRVGRMVAYLAASQAGVPLVALAGADGGDGVGVGAAAAAVGAVGACAALLGVTLATRHPAANWEDWSGYGRTRPVVAALFLYAISTCAGMPGTPGFVARLATARVAFSRGDDLLGLLCIGSIAVAAAPVVRLALFLFAKSRSSRRGDGAQPALGFIVLVGLCAAVAAVPASLGWLAALATPR